MKKTTNQFVHIAEVSRLNSKYFASTAEDAVIGDVKVSVRTDRDSTRRKEFTFGDLCARAIRSYAYQRASPVIKDKGIKQSIPGELENI